MRYFIKSYGISKSDESYRPDMRFVDWSSEGWENSLVHATFSQDKLNRIQDLEIGDRLLIHIVDDVGFMGVQVTESECYKSPEIDGERFRYVIDVSSYHVLPSAECAIPVPETRSWNENFRKRFYQGGFVEISKEDFLLAEEALRKRVNQFGTWRGR